jgi:sodium/bile acid cotransporter 7
VVFCGSQKSLVSGVPIAGVLVSAAAIGPVLLPIMLYYPMQLVVCAWMARRYAQVEDTGSLRLTETLVRAYARGGAAPQINGSRRGE